MMILDNYMWHQHAHDTNTLTYTLSHTHCLKPVSR